MLFSFKSPCKASYSSSVRHGKYKLDIIRLAAGLRDFLPVSLQMQLTLTSKVDIVLCEVWHYLFIFMTPSDRNQELVAMP